MAFLETPAGKLHYRSSGKGPTVLYIHGAAGMMWAWPPWMRREKGFHQVFVDLLDHGRSKAALPTAAGGEAGITPTLQQQLEALGFLIEHLCESSENERIILCGHSYGGALSQMLALRYPDKVQALVLVSTAARFKVLSFLRNPDSDAGRKRELVGKLAYHVQIPEVLEGAEQMLQAIEDRVIAADFAACHRFENQPLEELKVPLLIICGLQDRMTPPDYSRQLFARAVRARLEWIDNCGHMPFFEQPDRFREVLYSWLDSTAGRTRSA
jgi:pimeloyl-ACP methyl ester carboxylesterase